MKIKQLLIYGLVAVAVNTSQAQTVLPLDPAVRTGKLANGFTYYIRHNQEPKNRVTFYLANKVGSVLEADDQRGLAHFTEHMSFNGTKHFPKNELVNYLQKAGVRFGADLNAYTSFDETVYQLPLPADQPDIVKNGIEIMHDWAQGATLSAVEIDKERNVILEEKRLGKGAGDRMDKQFLPVILNHSRYANRLPIGAEEILKNFKPEVLRRYYHDWYRPNLQALIVVGDIDVDQMEQNIRTKFADLKNPVNEKPRTKYTVPLTGKNQFISVTDPEMTRTAVMVLIKQPKLLVHTDAQYRESIVRQLFNTMLSERYAELSRQADPPFLGGSASLGELFGVLDAYMLSVNAKPGELEKGFKAVWRENERAKRFGFTDSELGRAKTAYFNQLESTLKEKNTTPSDNYVREYLAYFLNGTTAPGIDYEFNLVKKELKGISLEELNKLAKTAAKTIDRDIVIQAPEKDKAGLPAESTVQSWISAVESENLEAYKDETSTKSLLSNQPVPGKIVDAKVNAALGFTTLTLSNGVKVLLKPTDFKNDEIMFSSFAPGGLSLYGDKDFQSAANAVTLITAGGVGNFDMTQLSKFLSDKQIGVQPYISDLYQGFSGRSTTKDLETSLELVNAYFTAPRKDSVMFKSIITRSKAALANRSNDPNSVFQDSSLAILYNNNYRKSGPSLAKLEQVNLDRAFAIYQERFSNAAGFTFIFVGSFDIEKIKPLLEKYLGSLPSAKKPEEYKDLGIQIAAGRMEKNIYKGKEAKATVQLIFSGAYDFSRQNNMDFDALKEVLQIRILERLREDEGGVYSPSVNFNTSKLPTPTYSLSISFGCSPANVDKLVASALDEIEKLKAGGLQQVNIDKWKAEYKNQMETNLRTNWFWMSTLNTQLQNDLELLPVDSYKDRIGKVSQASIKEMAVKYLSGKNYIRLVLLPERGIK